MRLIVLIGLLCLFSRDAWASGVEPAINEASYERPGFYISLETPVMAAMKPVLASMTPEDRYQWAIQLRDKGHDGSCCPSLICDKQSVTACLMAIYAYKAVLGAASTLQLIDYKAIYNLSLLQLRLGYYDVPMQAIEMLSQGPLGDQVLMQAVKKTWGLLQKMSTQVSLMDRHSKSMGRLHAIEAFFQLLTAQKQDFWMAHMTSVECAQKGFSPDVLEDLYKLSTQAASYLQDGDVLIALGRCPLYPMQMIKQICRKQVTYVELPWTASGLKASEEEFFVHALSYLQAFLRPYLQAKRLVLFDNVVGGGGMGYINLLLKQCAAQGFSLPAVQAVGFTLHPTDPLRLAAPDRQPEVTLRKLGLTVSWVYTTMQVLDSIATRHADGDFHGVPGVSFLPHQWRLGTAYVKAQQALPPKPLVAYRMQQMVHYVASQGRS